MTDLIFDVPLFTESLRDRGMNESSIETYRGAIETFLSTMPNVEKIDDYNSFIIKYAIKKRCTYYYNILRAFINWKIQKQELRQELISKLIRPAKKKDFKYERKYISEDKIIKVINNLDSAKHRIIGMIQTLTGIRAGDILKLKYGKINPEEYEGNPVLRLNVIGKGEKRNVVYIHDQIASQLILNYIANNQGVNDYYFLEKSQYKSRDKNLDNEYRLYKMNYLWYWYDLKKALELSGINPKDWATHDFRRCFARRAWERYKDIHILQGLLNHADPSTTLRYLDQSGLKNIDYLKDMQK
jgi:site-specific recombinase XerD